MAQIHLNPLSTLYPHFRERPLPVRGAVPDADGNFFLDVWELPIFDFIRLIAALSVDNWTREQVADQLLRTRGWPIHARECTLLQEL